MRHDKELELYLCRFRDILASIPALFKWNTAASCKKQVHCTMDPMPPDINLNFNLIPDGMIAQRNADMQPADNRISQRIIGFALLLSKSVHSFHSLHHGRFQLECSMPGFHRALNTAAGEDEDESHIVDDFAITSQASQKKLRMSKSFVRKQERFASSLFFKSEDDYEAPIGRARKIDTSSSVTCQEVEKEDHAWSPRMKSISAKCCESSKEEDRAWTTRTKPGMASSRVTSSKKLVEGRNGLVTKQRHLSLWSVPQLDSYAMSESNFDVEMKPEDLGCDRSYTDTQQFDVDTSDDTDSTKLASSHHAKARFDKFPISPVSIKTLHSVLKCEQMTQVQEATLPIILEGRDVLARARTGSDKMIAFLLPAIETIIKLRPGSSGNPIHVVVVCPTRELAQQAAKEAHLLLQFHRGIRAQVVHGGKSIRTEQMDLTRKRCQILVGTPGRLVDHIERTAGFDNQLRSVRMLVLDEADRMLGLGLRESLLKMVRALPLCRQTLAFSATITKQVRNMAFALKDDYTFIDTIGKDSQDTLAKVKQWYVFVPLKKQLRVLYAALQQHMEAEAQCKVLVFCTTARVTAFMCKLFQNLGINSREMHSRKDQTYRARILDEFHSSKGGTVLFTSDVCAQNVDYPDVTLVVQVGAPFEFETYIHRLGRAGRGGKGVEGLLILAPWEYYFLQKLTKLPITKMPPPKLSFRAKEKVHASACQVERQVRELAYTAWLAYYSTLKGVNMDKSMLVEYANQFSASMGFEEPPSLSRVLAYKMALAGVPGLRVAE